MTDCDSELSRLHLLHEVEDYVLPCEGIKDFVGDFFTSGVLGVNLTKLNIYLPIRSYPCIWFCLDVTLCVGAHISHFDWWDRLEMKDKVGRIIYLIATISAGLH